MRPVLLAAYAIGIVTPSIGWATEARTELSVGREFAFATGDVEGELFDGQLAIAGGLTMISDFTIERYGAQAAVEYRGEHVSVGIEAEFGPRQVQRGWASLDPKGELSLDVGGWKLRTSGGVLLRRVDAQVRRAVIEIRQLQAHGAVNLSHGEWGLEVSALCSFYDPELARPSFRDLDLGLAVTLAGKPERWALGARVERNVTKGITVEAALAGVVYATNGDVAVVPGLAIRGGPWRGVHVRAAIDLAVDTAAATDARLRPVGVLELAYER
jgi:hypothetical protein